MFRWIGTISMLGFILTVTANAELYITVTGANVKKAKLALGRIHALPDALVENRQLASKVYNQIHEDLDFTNLFEFIPEALFAAMDNPGTLYEMPYSNWLAMRASFVLRLGYKLEQGKLLLEALFYDIPGERKIFGNRYRYPVADYVRLAHA